MAQSIQIQPLHNSQTQNVVVGEYALDYLERLTISEEGKNTVCNEASDILSRCIPANQTGCITNLAVGYVQSGKTMSFTMLTALAADNGYKVIIYLTGTKNNLQNQTAGRLRKDLEIEDSSIMRYRVIDDLTDSRSFRMFLSYPGVVLLVPILKHYSHINLLTELCKDSQTRSLLEDKGIIIIDDEADQASLNTYARRNATLEDWEAQEMSSTYESITSLKRVLPNHSYVQYTATPQSLLLIDADDVLSPKYHTVLTPGEGYTGGKYFFEEHKNEHLRRIPDEEVDTKRNPLTRCPASLVFALRQFILSVSYKVMIRRDEKYLSMMVHVDGLRNTNEKYKKWVDDVLENWYNLAQDSMSADLLKREFVDAYNDLAKTIVNCPSLDDLFAQIVPTIIQTQTHLIHSGAESDINWNGARGHILVGANMLNRGFTIERLSMTFMPRTTAGVATADTIEQRCRFFGYKMNYIDVCRIYISQKARDEFMDYVEHEEIFREALKACPNHTLKEYKEIAHQLIISKGLKPTRKNILSKEYARYQMCGWKQFRTVDFMKENLRLFNTFVATYKDDFVNDDVYEQEARNHRYVDLDLNSAILWISHFQYYDLELRNRRTATIQYLQYLQSQNTPYIVRFYQMAYQTVRKRKLEEIGNSIKPINLHMGHSHDGVYPGDAYFKTDNMITVQLHHLKIEDDQLRADYNNKETCNIAIYYLEGLSFSYLEF